MGPEESPPRVVVVARELQDLRQHIAECRPKFHQLAISGEDRTNYQLQEEGLAQDERTELGWTSLRSASTGVKRK